MTKKDPLQIEGMHYGATPKVFRNAARLRKNMTDSEKKLWAYLKSKPMGYKFRRQHPISRYILDFTAINSDYPMKYTEAITSIKSKKKLTIKEPNSFKVWA
jgi:hypothetical protein